MGLVAHHHDRTTTHSRRRASRGEPYVEAYALRYGALIWDRYWRRFEQAVRGRNDAG